MTAEVKKGMIKRMDKIISIERMINVSKSCFQDLVEIGYMQASCNEDRFVDFGDAVRIFIEEQYSQLCIESGCLLGWFIVHNNEKRWTKEFPHGVSL